MTSNTLPALLRQTVREWRSADIVRMSGSLSYFAGLSILPLMLVGTSLAVLLFGSEKVENQIVQTLYSVIGDESAQTLRDAIIHVTGEGGTNTITNLISIVLLLYSTTHFFRHLRSSLRIIWMGERVSAGDVKSFVKDTLISLIVVAGAGVLLLLLLVVNTGLFFALQSLDVMLPNINYIRLWQAGGALILFIGTMIMFAVLYKLLPGAPIRWGDVWVGALFTAVLFTVGQFLIVLYLRSSQIDTLYGAAGALIIILIWVNALSHLLLFGAVFTKVYATRRGAKILTAHEPREQRRAPAPPQRLEGRPSLGAQGGEEGTR